MRTLHDCGENWTEFLECPDDEWVFLKGACHAFALELLDEFQKRGHQPALFYACSKEHDTIARHVFVQLADYYWDVTGRHAAATIAEAWSDGDQMRIRPVGHPGWISVPNHTPQTCFLGMMVDSMFMDRARQRARAFISANPERFGPV